MSLKLTPQKTKQSLNKSYLKNAQVDRANFDNFKAKLNRLLQSIDEAESEENVKNHLSDFLKDTFYKEKHLINTKGRTDLVIHAENNAQSPVNVLLEVKKPSNKTEMITTDNLNAKALQELMLYYLRERETENNTDIKYLIITNIYEFFIFEASDFHSLLRHDKVGKKFLKDFKEWESGKKSASTTDFFYTEIAKPFLENIAAEISATYFNIQDYKEALNGKGKEEKLLALYKIFSPEHLLKTYAYDSNKLNQGFYEELLHIIGLEEVKQKGKKLIQRKTEKKRDEGSLLENTITVLESSQKLSILTEPKKYGNTPEEQLYNIALELVITWVNRTLFLKLLEGQLRNFHKGDTNFRFLDTQNLSDFDDLYQLFFEVLAKKPTDRRKYIQEKYGNVPYLNSSLFEVTGAELYTHSINALNDKVEIPYFSKTVLVDNQGKKETGNTLAFDYLLRFLDAYDFSAEGQEKIQEHKKELINASVLGLIFEKINGYKDGSFYTPGFITMYMARETLRKTVLEKFNAKYQWDCKDFKDLYNRLARVDLKEANEVINAITVCDPAVGSGHFLVSVLNEFLAIKSDLDLLIDKEGKLLRGYHIEIENDELALTYGNGEIFEYQVDLKNGKRLIDAEIQRVQETIFQEKRHLIENCLFGVDINPNSVQICRLRLWIELLKHTYYKNEGGLEVLPNLDMKILEGNSLIPTLRQDPFFIDWEKGKLQATQSTQKDIDTINESVEVIRKNMQELFNLHDKERKEKLKRALENAKIEIAKSYYNIEILKTKNELNTLHPKNRIDGKLSKKEEKQKAELEALLQNHKNNHFEMQVALYYRRTISMFDWKIMFSDILGTFENGKNGNGEYGFDIVIGNPPYIRQEEIRELKPFLQKNYQIYHSIADLLTYFVELGYNLLRKQGKFQFIISNKFSRANYGQVMRKFLIDKTSLTHYLDFSGLAVFDEATVDATILGFERKISKKNHFVYADIDSKLFSIEKANEYLEKYPELYPQNNLSKESWNFESEEVLKIKTKVASQGITLQDWDITINYGIKTGFNEAFIIDKSKKEELIAQDPKSAEILKPLLRGRDIQKYYPDYQDLWLIGTHNGHGTIPKIEIKDYPAIEKHLNQYWKKIEKRYDKGDSPYNLRNCAYWQDFEKPKIIYPNMTKYLPFMLDLDKNYYHNDKSFHLVPKNLIYWLVSFLNSKLFRFCFRDNFPELLGGTRELRKVFFEKILVKQISEMEEKPFIEKVGNILSLKKANPEADTSDLEKEIDAMVYELYDLTAEDIEIVEG